VPLDSESYEFHGSHLSELERDYFIVIAYRCCRLVVAVLVWYKMLSFAEVNESIGPLIKSVIGMVNDVRNFLMLALATVLGFSFGFFALLSEQERQYLKNGGVEADDSGPRIDRFSEVIIFATYAMIGGLDADYTAFKDLSPGKFIIMVFFYVFYSVVSGVLLVNLLIAMVSDTYSNLQQRARLAHEYETCRTFFLYDRMYFLPSPLNLLPVLWLNANYVYSWAQQLWQKRQNPEFERFWSHKEEAVTTQVCGECLFVMPAKDEGASIFCKRCARHSVPLRQEVFDNAQLHQGVWLPLAYICIHPALVLFHVYTVVSKSIAAISPFGQGSADDQFAATMTARHQAAYAAKTSRSRSSLITRTPTEEMDVSEDSLSYAKWLAKQSEYGLNQRENLSLMKRVVLKKLLKMDEVNVDFTDLVMDIDRSQLEETD